MKPINSAVRTALYTALTAVSLTASLPAQTASASDLDALRALANQATQATQVTALGAGLNWYLSKAVRANFDVTQNTFDFQGARPTTGVLSDDELVFSTRFQVSF